MSKKTFKAAPKPSQPCAEAIDAYVGGGAGHDTTAPAKPSKPKNEPKKRLSIDLSEDQHRRFKVACAMTDRKMIDELLVFIERRTAELEQEAQTR